MHKTYHKDVACSSLPQVCFLPVAEKCVHSYYRVRFLHWEEEVPFCELEYDLFKTGWSVEMTE